MGILDFFKKKKPSPEKERRGRIDDSIMKMLERRIHIKKKDSYNPANGVLHPEYEQAIKNETEFHGDIGPFVTISASCSGCHYYDFEYSEIHKKGDHLITETVHKCTHPKGLNTPIKGEAYTPDWCPYVHEYLRIRTEQFNNWLAKNTKRVN